MKSRSGFTIIEIIVIIVVLAILATIATLSLNNLQMEQRDERRATSAGLIMAAAEKYYDQNGEYPYSEDLNPTNNQVEMPSYAETRAIMPELSDDILNSEGYHFMAYRCWSVSGSTNCDRNGATPAQVETASETAFLYFTAKKDGAVSGVSISRWGCKIENNSASNPALVIIWKSEATGKWNFLKSKRGSVTIANVGTPTPPTTCTFANA